MDITASISSGQLFGMAFVCDGNCRVKLLVEQSFVLEKAKLNTSLVAHKVGGVLLKYNQC